MKRTHERHHVSACRASTGDKRLYFCHFECLLCHADAKKSHQSNLWISKLQMLINSWVDFAAIWMFVSAGIILCMERYVMSHWRGTYINDPSEWAVCLQACYNNSSVYVCTIQGNKLNNVFVLHITSWETDCSSKLTTWLKSVFEMQVFFLPLCDWRPVSWWALWVGEWCAWLELMFQVVPPAVATASLHLSSLAVSVLL